MVSTEEEFWVPVGAESETKPRRRVFVLREVEVEMRDVQIGDLFRVTPAGEGDEVDPDYFIAKENAKVVDGLPQVDAEKISDVVTHQRLRSLVRIHRP